MEEGDAKEDDHRTWWMRHRKFKRRPTWNSIYYWCTCKVEKNVEIHKITSRLVYKLSNSKAVNVEWLPEIKMSFEQYQDSDNPIAANVCVPMAMFSVDVTTRVKFVQRNL